MSGRRSADLWHQKKDSQLSDVGKALVEERTHCNNFTKQDISHRLSRKLPGSSSTSAWIKLSPICIPRLYLAKSASFHRLDTKGQSIKPWTCSAKCSQIRCCQLSSRLLFELLYVKFNHKMRYPLV